ncbi:MAG: hypothetical protein R3A46_21705 [Thermomicrobiales bacterium]
MSGIAVADDEVYVLDASQRVQVFDLDGSYLREWELPESESGYYSIAVDAAGYVYLTRYGGDLFVESTRRPANWHDHRPARETQPIPETRAGDCRRRSEYGLHHDRQFQIALWC